MRTVLFLLSVILLCSAAYAQSCNQFFAPLRVQNNNCITLSIAGVHTQSLAQEGFKGFVTYSNGQLKSTAKFANLQTYETACSKGGKVQPFSADDALTTDVTILANNSILINSNQYPLSCGSDYASFQRENFHYFVAIKSAGSSTCPKLYYAEPCNLPTSTPSSTPTSPPASVSISYGLKVDSQWVTNGVTYYQYTATVTNSGTVTLASIKISSSNWNPTESWNIPSNGDGTYGFPSYITSFKPNDSYTFGFVSAQNSPKFTTVAYTQ